ncbi:MAG: Mth938-like domain-containing protein [Rhodothalassiaceae bacterium]
MRPAGRPGQPFIDGFRDGGFQIQGEIVTGPRLIWPQAHAPWPVSDWQEIALDSFAALPEALDLLLIGSGPAMRLLPPAVADGLRARGLALEMMDTGAAARTFNVLLAEDRPVAAALWPRDQQT